MAFTKKDIEQTIELLGLDQRLEEVSLESVAYSLRHHDTTCNCCFIGFASYGAWCEKNVEVLFAAA